MLNFSPIMLFQYAQNFTDYALNYAPNLPIILKLCPLFLLCTSQFHHQSQTRSRRLLGDLYQQTTWTRP